MMTETQKQHKILDHLKSTRGTLSIPLDCALSNNIWSNYRGHDWHPRAKIQLATARDIRISRRIRELDSRDCD